MKANMGLVDRIIRLVIALTVAILYFTGAVKYTLALVLIIVAGIFLLTAAFSFCPLYTIFKLNTKKKKTDEPTQPAQ